MPEGNEDSYKEMYEMGMRLVEMAKAGGYSPDSEMSEEDSDVSQKSYSSEDKVATALSMFDK